MGITRTGNTEAISKVAKSSVVRANLNALLPLVSGRPETANSSLDTTIVFLGNLSRG